MYQTHFFSRLLVSLHFCSRLEIKRLFIEDGFDLGVVMLDYTIVVTDNFSVGKVRKFRNMAAGFRMLTQTLC
jgi:hypothetical protein